MCVIGSFAIEHMVVEVNKVKEKWLEKKIQLVVHKYDFFERR